MTFKDLTILITTFHSDDQIDSCIKSIDERIKILIVENSSNENFKSKIEKKYTNVKCILAEENLGYAKGNNLGLSKINTKYVLILNPDTILESNAIKNFIDFINENRSFAILAPMDQENKKRDLTHKIKEVDYVKGYAMFLNLEQFSDIGFFDENFFIYLEEIDLCKRVKLKNKSILLHPKIKINHDGGSSHNKYIDHQMELSRNWHWMWSSFYYNKKYKGFLKSLLINFPKLASSLIKIIYYSIIMNKKKREINFHRFSGLFNSIIGNKSWYRPKINI